MGACRWSRGDDTGDIMHTLLRLITAVLVLIVGIALIFLGALGEEVDDVLAMIIERRAMPGGGWVFIALGAAISLLPAALIMRWLMARRYAREISYTTELGTVAVSLIAIEEALTRAVEQEFSVRSVQMRVYEDRVRRTLVIEAVLNLWDDGDITGINRRCQDLLRRRLAELMPEQEAVRIDLAVHRLNQRRQADAPTATSEVDPAGQPIISSPLPLPGLAATRGDIGSQAGAALLARRRSSEGVEGIVTGPGAAVLDRRLTDDMGSESDVPEGDDVDDALIEGTDEDDGARSDEDETSEDDLYRGPAYPVEDDDEED